MTRDEAIKSVEGKAIPMHELPQILKEEVLAFINHEDFPYRIGSPVPGVTDKEWTEEEKKSLENALAETFKENKND